MQQGKTGELALLSRYRVIVLTCWLAISTIICLSSSRSTMVTFWSRLLGGRQGVSETLARRDLY